MKKLLVLVFALVMVCSLAFAFNVSADEGTTNNIASEAEVTANTTSWWIVDNLGRLIDGKEDTGMHSSCHDRDDTITFKFAEERNVTKIVMKVNGTADTTAEDKTDLNAATEYKITFNGKTTTLNALDKRELVIEVNDYITEFSIYFLSNWSGDNALIREVEVYEYVPPVVEAATGKNIEDEATIKVVDGNDYIKDFKYLVDNDPSTGLSAGNAASWINYHFLYEKARAITKVVVVVNSTGTMYNVGSAEGTYVHETMSNLPNIYLRLYDSKGAIIYKLENQSTANAIEVTKDGKTYMEYTFDLGGALYEDVTKVEVATVHNKDTKLGVWEVEIFDFQCQSDEDHKYADATCSAPATCIYCGATTGEVSDEHSMLEANCGKPARCQYCDYTEGEPTGEPHQWMNASYTAPKTCKVCGATEGDVWVDSELEGFIRGSEDTVSYDDIIGEVELIAGSTGSGDPANVLNGTVANVMDRWGGPTNSQIKITLKNEWEITSAKVILASNWAGLKVSFYAADGTLLGEKNIGGLESNIEILKGNMIPFEDLVYTDYSSAISGRTYGDNDKAVKYIIITNTADKWGWVPAVMEVYFSGRERIPFAGCSVHDFQPTYPVEPTCTTEGTMVNKCTVCGAEEGAVVAPALGHNMENYTIKTPATCDTAAVIEFECTRCGETTERPTHIKDVTDYADIETAGANGAGGWTTSHKALFDNNMESYLHASGGWFVESWIDLDMPYYITSVTVWTGSWGDNNSWEAYFTFYYQAPGSDEWIEVGTKDAGVIKANTKNEHTLELAAPVYADAIKIRVDRLASFQGQAWEAEVAGVLFPEVAPLGHTWEVTEVVAAACDAGYTVSKCTVCGATKTDDYTKAIGHIWANATCLAPKTCTVCALTDGEALAHEYVAGEPAENGAITYTCKNGCEDSYVINNSAINGEYFMGTDAVVFNNGVLTAMGSEYTYTYNVTTGMVTTNDETIYFNVTDGVIYFKGATALHQHTIENCVKEAQEDGTVNCVCQFCGQVVYVINNAAINGEYFMGTDAVVFQDGKITAMGETFDYTYNVTTGMVTTSNEAIYFNVTEGVIYFKGATALHQHNGEGYIAETQENGAVNYVCPFCGQVMYVIDNAAINGEYFMDTDAVVFNNGVLTAMGTEFTYEYNVTSGMITTNNEAIYFNVTDGVIYFKGATPLHTHDSLEEEVTEATCTENGLIVYICQFCGPVSEEVIEATGHTWIASDYQPAKCNEAGYQNYYCEFCDATKQEILEADAVNGHFQNYSIPSDTLNATCTTAGYYKYTCLYCGEEITEISPVDTDWGHKWTTVEDIPLTCQNPGYKKLECSLCGAVEEYNYEMDPDYPEHVWDAGVAIPGGYHYECTLCDAEKDEITQGSDMDPIEAEFNVDNEVVWYIEGSTEVYFFVESEAGTVTLNIDAAAGVKMGYNPYMMYWDNFMTGSDSYTFEMDNDGRCLICISLDTEAYTVPESFSLSFEAKKYPQLEIGDNSFELEERQQVEYGVSVPGTYIMTVGENTNVIIPNKYGFSMIEEYPYEFTVAEGETIIFLIGTTNYEADTAVVTLIEKPAHVHNYVETSRVESTCTVAGSVTYTCDCEDSYTEALDLAPHTEEIIPAVPGELRNPGMTSGVKCSVCGEVIVAPVQASGDFRVGATSLTLSENIDIVYKIAVPAGYTNVYMVFTMYSLNENGVEEAKTFVVNEYVIGADGRYWFTFPGVRLQYMADKVTGTVYATNNGVESANSYSNYSVKSYIVGQLGKAANSAEFKTMLSDLIVLGDKAQIYAEYRMDTPISNDIDESLLTPSTYNGVPSGAYVQKMIVNDEATRAIADWKAVSLLIENAMTIQFKLAIDEAELENIVVKVTVPIQGQDPRVDTYTAEDFEYSASEDRYILKVQNIKVLQYGQTVVGDIYHNGVQISRTVNYSVNTYIQKNQDNANVPLRDFLRAIYQYGESAYDYAY